MLLVPAAAWAQQDCVDCHAAIAAAFKKPVVHPGECVTCHINHRAPGSSAPKPYLKAAQPALCLGCHEAGAEKLAAAHRHQPVDKSRCTDCHDPHASRNARLIYESQHGPFGGRHCDECHAEPVSGEVRLNGGKVRALCVTCHVKIGNEVADSKSPHAAFECTACHTPHASNCRPHLREPRETLCRTCHEGAGDKFQH